MTEGNSQKKRLILLVLAVLVIVVVLFFVQNSTSGNLQINFSADTTPPQVYIDRTSKSPDQTSDSSATYELSTGEHEVIVATNNSWPWMDEVTISAGTTTAINPILIPKNQVQVANPQEAITQSLSRAQTAVVPTSEQSLLSPNEMIRTFVDNGTNIIAQWAGATSSAPDYFNCEFGSCEISVYNRGEEINQLAFYPERSDALIFATESGVFVIEINPSQTGSGIQNIQPVIQNVQTPTFAVLNNRIFVRFADSIIASELR